MRPPAPLQTVPRRGFTLIELIIVVAIIAILSSLTIPVASTLIDKRRTKIVKEEAAKSRADYSIDGDRDRPVFERIELDLALSTSDHRLGLEVYSRYQLRCEGQIEISTPSASGDNEIALAVPFPRGTLEAWDVFLQLEDGTEPPDVVYNEKGIFWNTRIRAGETTKASVTFTTLGREQFEYMLPPAHRWKSVSIDLDTTGVPVHSIPDYALQPTGSQAGHSSWSFNNLVSERNLIVDLPGAQSPTSRLAVLFRFIGLAVLLFGAGFWHLSEQHKPGALRGFRWPHFLLLATIYSLFFIIFSVIIVRGEIPLVPAVLISSAASLPLLVLHVSRILDRQFATAQVLPLAVLTLGIVLAGVYGGGARDYILVAYLVIGVAYLTFTFRPPEKPNPPMPQLT